MGDAQAEADINMAITAKQTAWKQQRANTQDSRRKRAARRENTRVHSICDAAYERFLRKTRLGPEGESAPS